MEIDTGDHPPTAKKPYTLDLKHYDWVKEETDKLLEAGEPFKLVGFHFCSLILYHFVLVFWLPPHSSRWKVNQEDSFVAPFRKYEYLKVPFGHAQAPVYFQNLMNKVLNGLNFTLAYLDDVTICSETAEQHLKKHSDSVN